MRPIEELLDPQVLPTGDGDKDANGRLVVVGGPPTCPGAVVLAATAALRLGCGRVQLAVDPAVSVAMGIAVPESAVLAWDQHSSPPAAVAQWLASADTVVIGPGHIHLDDVVARSIASRTEAVILLDAGALDGLFTVARDSRVIVAPNPSEAEALLDRKGDEEELARDLAERIGQPVAVRGARTAIADGADCWCFDDAPSGLGTPGSGDVFIGALGALVASGVEPRAALAWATVLHASAARRLAETTPVGYLARQIVDELPFVRAAISR